LQRYRAVFHIYWAFCICKSAVLFVGISTKYTGSVDISTNIPQAQRDFAVASSPSCSGTGRGERGPFYISEKSPTSLQKSPISMQKSPLQGQGGQGPFYISAKYKRALYLCKRALYLCKRDLYKDKANEGPFTYPQYTK